MWNSVWEFVAPLVRQAFRNAQRAGLTLAQVGVLRVVAAGGPVSAGAVRRELGVTLPSVTSAVDHLERAGLVRRSRSPEDRRIALIALTERGAKALRRFWGLQHLGHRGMTRLLDPSERRELARLLGRLRAGLGGGPPRPIPYARCPSEGRR